MRKPQRIKKGEVITADFLNSLVDEAINRRVRTGGLLGGLMGILGTAQSIPPPQIRLVEAISRAEKRTESDDEFGNGSQVWSQECRFVSIRSGATGYYKDTEDGDTFRVYFPTHYRRLNGGNQTTVDHPPTWHQASDTAVQAGARFWAIFSASSGRWEYLGPPQQLIRFKLTADLAAGGSATATTMWSQAGTDAPSAGESITVYEWRNVSSMSTNDLGYAMWNADLGRWEVLMADGGTQSVPSINVGMSSTAAAENSFATDATTYSISWSADETVNTDTSVFGQTNQDPAGVYLDIQCKVAGTYRVWHHCEFDVTTTHTASQIQRARTYILKKVGGVGAESEIARSSCTCDLMSIDVDDVGVGVGSMRVNSSADVLVELDANDTVRVKFEYQSGNRGYDCVGESFGAQLIKRG